MRSSERFRVARFFDIHKKTTLPLNAAELSLALNRLINSKKLNSAIVKFKDWHYPWKFSEFVIVKLGKNTEEAMYFENICTRAVENDCWQLEDLAKSGNVCSQIVNKEFPDLN